MAMQEAPVADIISITMNPAVDISTSVERIEPVRKLRCRAEQREAGGGGINVARVIHRLGGDVLALYLAGGVVGEQLKRLVAKEQVPDLVIPIDEETRESFTVTDETSRDEFRFVLPGPSLTDSACGRVLKQIESVAVNAKYLVVSGSLPRGAPENFHAQLGALARRTDSRFVADAAGEQLRAAFAAGVYLAKPNLRELQEITEADLSDRSGQVKACRQLIQDGKATVVALTLGSSGALLVTEDQAWFSEPLPVKVVGTVGAGDSFLGALVWALHSEVALDEALRTAVAAGSAALLTEGTRLASVADIRRLKNEVRLQAV
jgi:6-phosphofructokinase 2